METKKKRVAIVGGGQGGLVAAKSMLDANLEPTVFEKSDDISGLWGSKKTAVWEGLYSNISRFSMSYSDHKWPENTSTFVSAEQVHQYLKSYAEQFNIMPHVRLNTRVDKVRQNENNTWAVLFTDLTSGESHTETFDFLVIASGLHSKPRIPEFERQQPGLKLIEMHSSQFRLNDPRLKDKRVIVLGCSMSGADIAANLVGHATSVVNVFSRPYLIAPRLIATPTSVSIRQQLGELNDECKKEWNGKYNIVPFDFFFWNRAIKYSGRTVPESVWHDIKNKLYREVFPLQTNPGRCIHPDLEFDLEKDEACVSISDTYLEKVKSKKVTPKRATIKRITDEGVEFADGTRQEADAIVYCTGYECNIDYLEPALLDKFKVDNRQNYRFNIFLSKYTFCPQIANLALVGQLVGLYFGGNELQAKLASMVFSGRKVLDREAQKQEVGELRAQVATNTKQMPYDSYLEISDALAQEMNLLPDFDELKARDSTLYDQFWFNCIFSAQFVYDRDREHANELFAKIDKICRQEYTFEVPTDEILHEHKVDKFSEHFGYQS